MLKSCLCNLAFVFEGKYKHQHHLRCFFQSRLALNNQVLLNQSSDCYQDTGLFLDMLLGKNLLQ